MNPIMTIDETTDVVDYESVTTSDAAARLTVAKIKPTSGPVRRAALIQFQGATHIVRMDPSAASVADADFRDSTDPEYGQEYPDGGWLIVRGTNNMTRLRAILETGGSGSMKVSYVG